MQVELSPKLKHYYTARSFSEEHATRTFLESSFVHKKRLYFDEVENANVWSFYLVDRDLHHAFEEFLSFSGLKIPYANWSRPERNHAKDDLGRATFPIAESATLYRKPVPTAGDWVHYVVEVLNLGEKHAVFGFLGFRGDSETTLSFSPSVVAMWLRLFVQYRGDGRSVTEIPHSLRVVLKTALEKTEFKL